LASLALAAATGTPAGADSALVSSTLPNGVRVAVLSLSGAQHAAVTLALRSPFSPGTDDSRVFLKAAALLLRERLSCGLPRTTLAPPQSPTAATLISVRDPLLLLTLPVRSPDAGEALTSLVSGVQRLQQVSPEEAGRALQNPLVLRRSHEETALALLFDPSPRLEDAPLSPADLLSALPAALAPSNLALAASLPDDGGAFAASIVAALGSLRGQSQSLDRAIPLGSTSADLRQGDKWTRVTMVLACPVRSPRDLAALHLASVLSAQARFSRLFTAARSGAALTYDIDSSVWGFGNQGVLDIGCTVGAAQAAETMALLREQMRLLAKSGPSQGELQAAKRFLAFQQHRLRETPEQWSAAVAGWVGNFGPRILDLSLEQALDLIGTTDVSEVLAALASRSATLSASR
jgi:hypothetical protein